MLYMSDKGFHSLRSLHLDQPLTCLTSHVACSILLRNLFASLP
nr:MAG TPA: hypothetical protein [Caudoviricetes sp.]